MEDKITLSVVMPTLNEEGAIEVVINDIKRYAQDYETEIIIVDSSTDRTPEIAQKLGAKVISKEPAGHGHALRTGLEAAQNDIIITADCDNTYPMEYIPRLVEYLRTHDCDLISCNRLTKQLKEQMPFLNKIVNWGFAFLVRTIYGAAVHDVATGMFCMTRKLIQDIKLENYLTVPIELIIRAQMADFGLHEMDIPYRTRIGDVTLPKWRAGKAGLRCIFNYRFNLNIEPKKM